MVTAIESYIYIYIEREREDISFLAVNTKSISSSVLKTSEFSRVRSTSEIIDVSTHEMTYIWYLPKKKADFLLFHTF